ncbi:MAG: RNA-binding domain-containing protein [Candidatus Bathyarchaeia archaeon]
MQSKLPVTHIEIRVFAHATEDEEKVLKAVRNILPAKLSEDITFKKTGLAGHHGNPIVLYQAKIKEKEWVKAFLEGLSAGLTSLDKEVLNREIRQHIDRGCLYIRLDKQAAYNKEFKICSTDPIHVRIHFKRSKPDEIVKICGDYGII